MDENQRVIDLATINREQFLLDMCREKNFLVGELITKLNQSQAEINDLKSRLEVSGGGKCNTSQAPQP